MLSSPAMFIQLGDYVRPRWLQLQQPALLDDMRTFKNLQQRSRDCSCGFKLQLV
jgi:hypothetical protein